MILIWLVLFMLIFLQVLRKQFRLRMVVKNFCNVFLLFCKGMSSGMCQLQLLWFRGGLMIIGFCLLVLVSVFMKLVLIRWFSFGLFFWCVEEQISCLCVLNMVICRQVELLLKSGLKYVEDDCLLLSMDCLMCEYSRVLFSILFRLVEMMVVMLWLLVIELVMVSCFLFLMWISVKYYNSDNVLVVSSIIFVDMFLFVSSLVSSFCGLNDNGLCNFYLFDYGVEIGIFVCFFLIG